MSIIILKPLGVLTFIEKKSSTLIKKISQTLDFVGKYNVSTLLKVASIRPRYMPTDAVVLTGGNDIPPPD